MALDIGEEWITSDRCKQVAKATRDGWVLSWCSGRFDRDEAVAAMNRAEEGDLSEVVVTP
ncbi:hypothetical protein [Spirillospora sp. NPDC047279]|uniref:hypothetical protein n=1 Tax=Spirillospora sp. NPDC047279 TaxID=3155478 RepID=UPI0033F377D7